MNSVYFAQTYYRHMMDGGDWGWGLGMMLFWLVLLVVIIVVVVKLLTGQINNGGHKNDPLDIAKERYAKGEIKKEEFEQLKKDIK